MDGVRGSFQKTDWLQRSSAPFGARFRYEVGVVEMPDGTFTLRYDFWSSGGLAGKLGAGAGLLKQAYGIEAAKIAARRKGFSCYEQVQEDGKTIELVMRRVES